MDYQTSGLFPYVDLEQLNFENMMPLENKLPAPEPVEMRECHFVGHEQAIPTPVFDQAALTSGCGY